MSVTETAGVIPRVAVVGMGYVGLPLAREAVRAGYEVIGVDSSASIAMGLVHGVSHVDDVSNQDVSSMVEKGFVATIDTSLLATADTIVICVPTPLSEEGTPDLSAIEAAGRSVAENLRHGQLVVLESTTYPGTTQEILQPIIESTGLSVGRDVFLGYSPERVDPGNSTFSLRNTPKIVSGITDECRDRAVNFYSDLVDEVVISAGVKEAEMTKLLENTYRHINIALVNEMAQFCSQLQIDLWEVIRCAKTKPFGFSAFYPGPGVGGHCIPIDPNYLSHRVQTRLGYAFRFVELAQEINDGMPAYVVSRIQRVLNDQARALRNSRVLLLGVTYKADIADTRESPAKDIAALLTDLGAHVSFFDPLVTAWETTSPGLARVSSLAKGLRETQIAVLLQAHSAFDFDVITESGTCILDTRGVLNGPNIVRL